MAKVKVETDETEEAISREEINKAIEVYYNLTENKKIVIAATSDQRGLLLKGLGMLNSSLGEQIGREKLKITTTKGYVLSIIPTTKVIWDAKSVKSAVGKQFVLTQATITNYSAFVKLMKEKGISKKEVEGILDITQTVDEEKMKQALKAGEISQEDVAECYVIQYGEPKVIVKKEEKA